MDFFDDLCILEEISKIEEFQKIDKLTNTKLEGFDELVELIELEDLKELNQIDYEKEIENQLKRLQKTQLYKRKNEKKDDGHNKISKRIKLQPNQHFQSQPRKFFKTLLDAFIYLNIDKTNINLYNLVKKVNLIKDLERLEYYGILELDDIFKILLYYLSQPLTIYLNRLIMFQNSSFNKNIKIYININIFKNQEEWQKQLELLQDELESIKTLKLTSFQRRLNLSGFRIDHKSEFEVPNKRVYAFTNIFER